MYDVSSAFKRVENELIDSMVRNLKRHQVEETLRGMDWEQWQVLQLKELEKYRLENPKKFAKDFDIINKRVDDILHNTYTDASTKEEAKILDMIRKGKIADTSKGAIEGTFFGLNASRLEHLVQATKADFVRGEWSMLRQANDKYRQVIFDAQVYSATGATYAQAVDMATKDFLQNGIQSITYKNGSRHTIQSYAEMALRTGQKRAYLMGEGDVHDKYGIHTVRVNKRENACPLCVKWLGRVLIDDVYAGGTHEEAQKLGVPLLSEAIDEGFLHPNCKDVYSMYIEGISKPAEPWTKQEMQEIADNYNVEQEVKRAEDMTASYNRMAKDSLDPDNQQRYQAKADAWQGRLDELKGQNAFDMREFTSHLDLWQGGGYGYDLFTPAEQKFIADNSQITTSTLYRAVDADTVGDFKIGDTVTFKEPKSFANGMGVSDIVQEMKENVTDDIVIFETRGKTNAFEINKYYKGAYEYQQEHFVAGDFKVIGTYEKDGLKHVIIQDTANNPTQMLTTVNGKTFASKQLGTKQTGKALPFEKKLNPTYDQYKDYIIELEKAKADDAILKPLYEKAIPKAEAQILKYKIAGETNKMPAVYKQKKKFTTKLQIMDLKDEVSALDADLLNAKTVADDFELLNDYGVSNVWKDTVYLHDYDKYLPKVQDKMDWFVDKITEWDTKGVSQYNKTQAFVDQKVAELQKQLDSAIAYEADAMDYKAKYEKLLADVKKAEDALTAKKDELLKLENPKAWAKQNSTVSGTIDQARRDKALWAKTKKKADDALRPRTGEVWRNATNLEKDAIYEYTYSYHKFNEPLRGIEYGTNKYKGVGKTDLNPRSNGQFLNAMTDLIEKSSYDFDMWFQRGVHYDGMDKFFGVDLNVLRNATQTTLEKELLGKTVTEYGFMSMGSAKGQGFNGGIIMNIFAPKGTKMMYVEPFSQFGHGFGRGWDGVATQSSFGRELETILQQGTMFKVTKVERSGGTLYIDLDVIGNAKPQRWK